jgi:hypothetical protein
MTIQKVICIVLLFFINACTPNSSSTVDKTEAAEELALQKQAEQQIKSEEVALLHTSTVTAQQQLEQLNKATEMKAAETEKLLVLQAEQRKEAIEQALLEAAEQDHNKKLSALDH